MILLRLKIKEPFRCLQKGFELVFQNEWDRSENRDGFAPYVLAHIKIVKVPGSSAKVHLLNHPDIDANKPLPRTEAAEMLPEYVPFGSIIVWHMMMRR